MARIRCELLETTPPLSGLGISPTSLERYGVVEARLNPGRGMAVPFIDGCTKILRYDGTSSWDGDYVPEAGLFGQRSCTESKPTLLICAHEFEALRVASVIEQHPKYKHLHPVALPVSRKLNAVELMILVDSLKVVSDSVVVWNATKFDSLRDSVENFITVLDESTEGFSVQSLSMGKLHSPLDLSDTEILNTLRGPKRVWSPGDILTAQEIFESAKFFETTRGYDCGISKLNSMINGLRIAELVMFTAGTGIGKSTLVRQIVYHLVYREGRKAALGFFEETKEETLKKLACLHYGISLLELQSNPNRLTKAEWEEFLNLPATKNLRFIVPSEASGGFGAPSVDALLNRIRYLKRKDDIDFAVVDHISLMVSGRESSKEGERKDLDILMTRLAMACVMLNVGILAISHLSNGDGKPAEEGGRVFLQQLRGSGAIKQLSWCVIASERNQQSTDSNLVLVRVLKNRNGGGVTGLATCLEFKDPFLVERTDVDLLAVAANLGNGGGSTTRSKRTNKDEAPKGNLFDEKPGKRVIFGKLNE